MKCLKVGNALSLSSVQTAVSEHFKGDAAFVGIATSLASWISAFE